MFTTNNNFSRRIIYFTYECYRKKKSFIITAKYICTSSTITTKKTLLLPVPNSTVITGFCPYFLFSLK